MEPRRICEGVRWVGAVDWNFRLFDSQTPPPGGTSYNAYLVWGAEKTVLIDTLAPAMEAVLMNQLVSVDRVDYVISHHAEQEHSGAIPPVLAKYSHAIVVCSVKAKGVLVDHFGIAPDRVKTVEDGELLSLGGGKTLRFVYTPWFHWPEAMVTNLVEDRILFACDFFASHIATAGPYAVNDPYAHEAAKRYYAEIMMPYHKTMQSNLTKIKALDFDFIAPSHGPIYYRATMAFKKFEIAPSRDSKIPFAATCEVRGNALGAMAGEPVVARIETDERRQSHAPRELPTTPIRLPSSLTRAFPR